MWVAVDVVDPDVGCAADQVDFDLFWWAVFWVVGFVSVVTVGWSAPCFVNSDQTNMSCFEETV